MVISFNELNQSLFNKLWNAINSSDSQKSKHKRIKEKSGKSCLAEDILYFPLLLFIIRWPLRFNLSPIVGVLNHWLEITALKEWLHILYNFTPLSTTEIKYWLNWNTVEHTIKRIKLKAALTVQRQLFSPFCFWSFQPDIMELI